MRFARIVAVSAVLLAPGLPAQDAPETKAVETAPAAAETRAESRPAEIRQRHPRMGVRVESATLERQNIARVESVAAGSPAERAGIKVGDVIVKVAGQDIRDDKTYRDVMSRRRAGDAVAVLIRRGSDEFEAEVVLPDRPTTVEPESVVIQHVLIGHGDKAPTQAGKSRTLAQARKLAEDVMVKAKNGADFGELVKSYSEDQGSLAKNPPGSYTLVQDKRPKPTPDAYEKSGMVPGFSAVAFLLDVGDVAVAEYDPSLSPYGFHVIKRIK